jgi:heptosyltransferase-2
MKKILVLRGGALGDFIVTLPALRLLRNRWPSAQIELVGNARAAELGLIAGAIDRVHSQAEARWSQLYGSVSLSSGLKEWLDEFDLIVSFWPDLEGELCRHFSHRGTSFISSNANVETQPAAVHFCEALRPLGLKTDDYLPLIVFPDHPETEATRRLAGFEDFIALHPGSGLPRKNWPVERWMSLAGKLSKPLLIVTGEAERDCPHWPDNLRMIHAHAWPLPLLGAALAKCSCFIGHDSGISHLAAAADAPCILLFGPTNPAVWAPPGVRVIKNSETMATITVDEVVAVANATLAPAKAD